jgi:hypothetical protein
MLRPNTKGKTVNCINGATEHSINVSKQPQTSTNDKQDASYMQAPKKSHNGFEANAKANAKANKLAYPGDRGQNKLPGQNKLQKVAVNRILEGVAKMCAWPKSAFSNAISLGNLCMELFWPRAFWPRWPKFGRSQNFGHGKNKLWPFINEFWPRMAKMLVYFGHACISATKVSQITSDLGFWPRIQF